VIRKCFVAICGAKTYREARTLPLVIFIVQLDVN
jgi:hypothetical protein